VAATGPRLIFVWQVQCTKPSRGAAARVTAAACCMAGAMPKAF
jgi:hypothetical protein